MMRDEDKHDARMLINDSFICERYMNNITALIRSLQMWTLRLNFFAFFHISARLSLTWIVFVAQSRVSDLNFS